MTYSPTWGSGGPGGAAWGAITGTLSAQTDLNSALAGKQAAGSYQPLAAVLTGTTASFTTAQETKLSTLSGTSSGTNTGDQNLAPYATLASPTFTGTVSGITAAMVGLGNVTNVAQTSVTGLTGTQSVATFKTGLTLVKGDVGLGSVDNTSDAGKPVSTAQQTALNLKANIASLAAVATSGSAADLTGNLAVARLNSGTGASASTFWRGDGTWAAAAGGGSDPWTYLKLAADFPTSLATWTTVTGMQFTPAANTDYEVEWCLNCLTAVTTTGARPGVAWGTGYQYGGVALFTPSSATAQTIVNGSITTVAGTAQAAVGGLPIINRTYAHYGQATFRSGAVPTAFQLQLASETAATAVTAKAGSWLKYRTI